MKNNLRRLATIVVVLTMLVTGLAMLLTGCGPEEEEVPTPASVAHSPRLAWQAGSPGATLTLAGALDLSETVSPTLTFWQQFALPQGSMGQVVASANSGLTWEPVLTITEPILDWTQVEVDLSDYAGQEIGLAFHLSKVTTETIGGQTGCIGRPGNKYAGRPTEGERVGVRGGVGALAMVLPMLGMPVLAVVRRQREKRSACRWIGVAVTFLALACGPCTCCSLSSAPASPYASENRLQDVLGEVEPVVLAEQYPLLAKLSPDGRWLLVLDGNEPDNQLTLIDLEQGKSYAIGYGSGDMQWIDDTHVVFSPPTMLRVPDLTRWGLEVRRPDPDSLDVLEGADHVYALENLTGGGSVLVTTDPAFPYWVSVNWEGTELGEHLAGIPHTIIQAGGIRPDPNQKHYSPDGHYYMLDVGQAYLEGVRFTREPLGCGPVMFDAATGQEIARALKRDWCAYFLGWAYDSSGAYFMFKPITADADLLHPRHPIYKLLVPGAKPGGTPVPMYTPTPTSEGSVKQRRNWKRCSKYGIERAVCPAYRIFATTRSKEEQC